jgi:hypothetical protein
LDVPPGSPCSIIFGKGVTTAVPGSVQGLFLIVDEIEAARAQLLGCGVDVSEVFQFEGGLHVTGTKGRVPGPDPEGRSYRSWAEKRHGEYEPTAPKHHWSGWYAAYIDARERGRTPEEAAKDGALHIEGARR